MTQLLSCISHHSLTVSDRCTVLTLSWWTAKIFMNLITRRAVIRPFSRLCTLLAVKKEKRRKRRRRKKTALFHYFYSCDTCQRAGVGFDCGELYLNHHIRAGEGGNKPIPWKQRKIGCLCKVCGQAGKTEAQFKFLFKENPLQVVEMSKRKKNHSVNTEEAVWIKKVSFM